MIFNIIDNAAYHLPNFVIEFTTFSCYNFSFFGEKRKS